MKISDGSRTLMLVINDTTTKLSSLQNSLIEMEQKPKKLPQTN